MRVVYSADVESDLDAIADYIALDNPRRAVTFLQEIRREIEHIGRGPLLYQLRPDVGEDARVGVVGRYVVLFRIENETVYVERIVHGSRLLSQLFL